MVPVGERFNEYAHQVRTMLRMVRAMAALPMGRLHLEPDDGGGR